MKSFLGFVAVCFTAAVLGCQTSSTVSPGALSNGCGAKEGAACTKDKSECCGAKKCDGASMGAVSEKAPCASKCESKCSKEADANLSAVSEKAPCGSGCSKAKSGCTKEADANLGAVSEKSGCHHIKSGCTKEADANLGAVSEKTGCGAKRSGCGSN